MNWTCCICKQEIAEKFHIDGRNYCREHAKNVCRQSDGVWTETVRGTIIGGDDRICYQFWSYAGHKIAECNARSDGEAAKWFEENHPAEFARGAEMRAFDI